MRRLAEIVIGREPKPLRAQIELFEQPPLRPEAIDHRLLSRDVAFIENDRRSCAYRQRPLTLSLSPQTGRGNPAAPFRNTIDSEIMSRPQVSLSPLAGRGTG